MDKVRRPVGFEHIDDEDATSAGLRAVVAPFDIPSVLAGDRERFAPVTDARDVETNFGFRRATGSDRGGRKRGGERS